MAPWLDSEGMASMSYVTAEQKAALAGHSLTNDGAIHRMGMPGTFAVQKESALDLLRACACLEGCQYIAEPEKTVPELVEAARAVVDVESRTHYEHVERLRQVLAGVEEKRETSICPNPSKPAEYYPPETHR